MKKNKHIDKESFFEIVLTSFIERFNVFSNIFGYSFLVAVVFSIALILLAKYFLYASMFFMGIITAIFLLKKEDDVCQYMTYSIKKLFTVLKREIYELTHPDHNHNC